MTTSYWMIFQGDQFLIDNSTTDKVLTQQHTLNLQPALIYQHQIAQLDNAAVFCAELPTATALPPSIITIPFRKALDILDKKWYNIATRAYGIISWDKNHLFCGHCGQPTIQKNGMFERICSQCGLIFYPRISPSIIVLINRGDEMLMARGPHFNPGVYGLIAGFVEPGESAEDAVHREVNEEVGIQIKNLRYVGSQSWPFPDSLMFAFTAEYASGELVIDHKELETAGWFHYDNIPGKPSFRSSMAYKLIEHFIAERRRNS